MYCGRGIGGLAGAPGGCESTAPASSGMAALAGDPFCLGTDAASENIFLRGGQLGKGRFLEVVWHLAFQCCGEVLGFGYDCVARGDGWVGDVLVFVKKVLDLRIVRVLIIHIFQPR